LLETRLDILAIFTDIEMSGSMDGLKLAHAVRGRWPPIKIIATSGHFKIREGDLPDGAHFMPKPYSWPQIIRTLRELTSGASRG
jgi:DNA-binding NtrC family response regulator